MTTDLTTDLLKQVKRSHTWMLRTIQQQEKFSEKSDHLKHAEAVQEALEKVVE